jgi:PTS system nitrogen regulatory IIA component
MTFVDRLRPGAVCIAPPWRSFRDTIAGLVELLAADGGLPSGAGPAAIDAVMAREAQASTALLDIGTGVPHARLAGIDNALVALAVSAPGLYEAVPTVPIRLVALVLSPPHALTDHLEILAGVAMLLRSPELRARLLAASDAATALRALREHARTLP